MKHVIFFLCLAGATFAQAQKPSRDIPLLFPADKNNLQILTQRFEYSLEDDQDLRIGDVAFDINKVSFRLESNPNAPGVVRGHFTWPAGLINQGELAIKNNAGIAIFNTAVKPKDITLEATAPTASDDDHSERTQLASVTVDLPADLLNQLRYSPFFTFCIFRAEEQTKMYLCSSELYLANAKTNPQILPRQSRRTTAQVVINGKVVGNQGYIYLNSSSENVDFTALTKTGAFLDIQTRRQDVDFKDIYLSDDGKEIVLTGAGAHPANEKRTTLLPNGDWRISLPVRRPILYLKGDGDIPLRQEFNIRGELPRNKLRPVISQNSVSSTYSSRLTLTGRAPAVLQLDVPEDDKDSTLQKRKNGFTWILNRLPANTKTRRYLTATADGRQTTVGYDVYRGLPFNASVGVQYQFPSSVAVADLEVQWWMENFLAINSSATRLRWGLAVERSQTIVENSDYVKADITTVELLWRARPGMNMIDGSWGLSLPVQMVQTDAESLTAFGLGAFWLKKTEGRRLKKYLEWSQLKFTYLSGSSGDAVKLDSGLLFEALGYKSLSPTMYWRYGAGLSQYKFSPAAKDDFQFSLLTSLMLTF